MYTSKALNDLNCLKQLCSERRVFGHSFKFWLDACSLTPAMFQEIMQGGCFAEQVPSDAIIEMMADGGHTSDPDVRRHIFDVVCLGGITADQEIDLLQTAEIKALDLSNGFNSALETFADRVITEILKIIADDLFLD